MSVDVRSPSRSYHDDAIRRHSITMAMMSDVSSSKKAVSRDNLQKGVSRDSLQKGVSRDSLHNAEPIRQFSLEEHLDLRGIDSSEGEAAKGEEEEEDDMLSNTESTTLDIAVLQMDTSRMVGSSLANQLVAESLNISPDESNVADDIVAAKVPTVDDIPRASVVDENDIAKVGGASVASYGSMIIHEDVEELEIRAPSAPSNDHIYTLVEAHVKVKRKIPPGSINETSSVEPAPVSPIYSKVVKTVPRPPDDDTPISAAPPDVALTRDEARDVLDFINNKISSRSQLNIDSEQPISVKEVESIPSPNVNDLSEEKPDGAKPKLSFLNKLKKSFKSCSPDKNKSPPIPQLARPPSTYIGSQLSLNGSVSSTTQQHSAEKPHTPVLELLAKNPEMCSQDSLSRLPQVKPEVAGEVRAVMSDPDLAASTTTGRSRATRRGDRDKTKRRSRSRSITKFFGDMARKAKSLTEVSPIPRRSEDGQMSPDSARYANDTDGALTPVPPTPLSPPPPLRATEPDIEADKPEKKRLSLVGRIKRKLSIGKGDKADKTSKTKELSRSTPVLTQSVPAPTAIPRHIKRAKSTENMSTTSSNTTTTDVRTQIVLKSAKINKGCRCQVCTLVRRNIRSHCGTADPNAKHKYEVVLKMNLLGADFMNSECGSIASYQGYELPEEEERPVIEGCIAGNITAELGSIHSIDHQLRTKTQSEIEEIVQDFQQETKSVSSRGSDQNTDNDLSELMNVTSSPRQSAV